MLLLGFLIPAGRNQLWAFTGVLGAGAAALTVWKGLRASRGGVDILALLAIAGLTGHRRVLRCRDRHGDGRRRPVPGRACAGRAERELPCWHSGHPRSPVAWTAKGP